MKKIIFTLLCIIGAVSVDAQTFKVYENGVLKDTYTNTESKQYKIVMEETPVVSHEYVDLGLPSGTLWATMNVGATSITDYGDYFAWGETETKSSYNIDLSNYKYSRSESEDKGYTKYMSYYNRGFRGFYDDKTTLDLEDDAAHVNWGGSWRMPTKAEFEELENYCTWTWETINETDGYKVTGSNGKWIFLPAAGQRYDGNLRHDRIIGAYWSNELWSDNTSFGYFLHFLSGGIYINHETRCAGFPVRAVCSASTFVESIELSNPSLALTKGENSSLEFSILPINATDKSVTWTSSDLSVATVSENGTVTAINEGSCIITCTANDGSNVKATCSVTVSESSESGNMMNGHEYVDLGLPSGTLWATCNVGANKPEEYGDYFAWGETSIKQEYTKENYTFGGKEFLVDNDIANILWQGNWQIPTFANIEEIINNCSWTLTSINGFNGYIVEGKNRNSIFLPLGGHIDNYMESGLVKVGIQGSYWTSTESTQYESVELELLESSYGIGASGFKWAGRNVRPVCIIK